MTEFLNELYSNLDSCIDEFDVYKVLQEDIQRQIWHIYFSIPCQVESISDSYMVASGLPVRNGDQHAPEICSMALELVEVAAELDRPDRRGADVALRVGIHTGTAYQRSSC